MDEPKIDIGLCTSGKAHIQQFPNDGIVPVTNGNLYIKYSDSELCRVSSDFNSILISDIPISAFQEAAHNLGKDSKFKYRLVMQPPVCSRRVVGRVSPKFRSLFEQSAKIVLMLGSTQSQITNYHFASFILYHLGNDIRALSEVEIWNTLCEFINVDRITFCINMRRFLEYDTLPTVSEMAKELTLSETWFKTICKRYLGDTPHRWFLSQQLHRAHILALTSSHSVGQIGALCKFDNNSHFIKLFKREFGMTPLKVRQSVTGKPRVRKPRNLKAILENEILDNTDTPPSR